MFQDEQEKVSLSKKVIIIIIVLPSVSIIPRNLKNYAAQCKEAGSVVLPGKAVLQYYSYYSYHRRQHHDLE